MEFNDGVKIHRVADGHVVHDPSAWLLESGEVESDRRNILNVRNVHGVISVYRNFSMIIERMCRGQAVGSNDSERFGETGDGSRLGSVGVMKGLKVMISNVRDLKSGMKYEELQLLAEESELDIVAVTESWANSSVMNAELALDGLGFRMFRKDCERDVEQMVGGVLLYMKNNIVVWLFSL